VLVFNQEGKNVNLPTTRNMHNATAHTSGTAVSLSPSEGERAGVRGVPAPTKQRIARARRLRKQPTWAEKALWKMLRGERFAGYKFRRQHPFGEYDLDFYCPEALLVVEVDGIGHGHPDKQKRDAERDAFLSSLGIIVKRIWNSQLKREPQVVRDNLWLLLQERAPHPGNVKPARRVTSRVLHPDYESGAAPHPALSPSEGERVANVAGRSDASVKGVRCG
jgi:very-short-patch-repair endonuclease